MSGVSASVGDGLLMASYLRHNDETTQNRDASQWGIGYNYPLSKRTSIYSAFANIHNRHGATYTVGNQTETGTGNQSFNAGVVHNF